MTNLKSVFPDFPSRDSVIAYLQTTPKLWDCFSKLPEDMREMLIGYFLGQNGLPVTFDPVFQMVFDPEVHPERLEALLSALFRQTIKIVRVLKREGTMLTERGSFVIMDVLVLLDNGIYANIEMQKIGYKFPIERSDCYGADIIMRQYAKLKDKLGNRFHFRHLQKVFCIVLMEQSPAAFKEYPNLYIHHRFMQFDTGIMEGHTGLHEDIFFCLDTFRKNVHNVDKSSSKLDVWLFFLSATDTESILNLITEFPEFLPIYQEISEFSLNPEVLLNMLSQELYIMDRNTERLMVNELQEEVETLKTTLANTITEKDNELAEKDNSLAEKDNALAEKDNIIAELRAQLAQK